MARRRISDVTVPLEDTQRTPREVQLGSYRVLAALARGGTSGVYLGEHVVTGERVALKVLDAGWCHSADAVARLLAERAISERVCHAGLLDVRFADRSAAGVPYLVMEYVDGDCLAALAERREVGAAAAIEIGAQVAGALAALHAAGVAHCDVKPANVLVPRGAGRGGRPRAKVIDYGVARRLDEPPRTDGAIAGTPAYMPPEQWRGAPVAASDVYALGCLLYELLAGQPVFAGPLPRLMRAHCADAPEPLAAHRPDLPASLDRLLSRALAKAPGARPPALELALALEAHGGGGAAAAAGAAMACGDDDAELRALRRAAAAAVAAAAAG